MRRQRVDFGNPRHTCHKRGADRAPRTYKITVLHRILNQFMRYHIHNGETVFGYRIEFALKPFRNDCRQVFSVDFLCSAPCYPLQFLLRTVDVRRVYAFRNWAYLLNHIGYSVCVLDYNFKSLFFAQIAEFLKHFLGGAEIQRQAVIGVFKALSGKQDFAVDFIRRVNKMRITGGADRYVQHFAEADDCTVEFAQLLFILCHPVAQQEKIVGNRLYFKKIVKPGDFAQLVPRFSVDYRLIKLPLLAAAADYQSLSVFKQL